MGEIYSLAEIARAAGVTTGEAAAVATAAGLDAREGVAHDEAVRLVRVLAGREPLTRGAITTSPNTRRRVTAPLLGSAALHVLLVLGLGLAASLHWLRDNAQLNRRADQQNLHLVFFNEPGPGGGGGGGGDSKPTPPAPAKRKAPTPSPKVNSPVPPRVLAPPPRPVITKDPVRIETPVVPTPTKVEPKPAPPAVVAPVVSLPADPVDAIGALDRSTPAAPSNGSGIGGGAGTGAGTGIGSGDGAGIGPGSGGGTGGGPFKPGSGIDPPSLLREVKPLYTDEARRRRLEGDVDLQLVVKSDGSVADVHIVRGLGAGLDERAVEAVRQWRFAPAHRRGNAVDVVVQVSVGFSMK